MAKKFMLISSYKKARYHWFFFLNIGVPPLVQNFAPFPGLLPICAPPFAKQWLIFFIITLNVKSIRRWRRSPIAIGM